MDKATNDEPKWIRCPGCSGQIGVPDQYPAEVVCCPKCAAVVQIDERMRVLWRPHAEAADVTSPTAPSRWIGCHGCKGEIGVPLDWFGPTIACPKCGSIVAMRETGRVLWKPPNAPASSTAEPSGQPSHIRQRSLAITLLLLLGRIAASAVVLMCGYVAIVAAIEFGSLSITESVGVVIASTVFCLGICGWIFRCRKSLIVSAMTIGTCVACFVVGDWYYRHSATGVIARVEELGGTLTWEGESDAASVVAVDLRKTSIREEDIECLPALEGLKRLDLSETSINGYWWKALEAIRRLPNLQWISLYRTELSSWEVDALSRDMPELVIVDQAGFMGDLRARQQRAADIELSEKLREQRAEDALDGAMRIVRIDIESGRQSLRQVTRSFEGTAAARKAQWTLESLDDPFWRYRLTGRIQ